MNNVVIREVSSAEDALSVAAFFRTIWQDGDDVAPFDLILATVHVGAYCVLAEIDGQTVGASFAVRGVFNELPVLHSHVTATTVAGVGYDIKSHQFVWAKQRGIKAITWTFDPLVRRNCYFNFVKLGASAIEYLPNFYGDMTDSINRGDESDRLFAFWSLADSQPQIQETREATADEISVEIPEDIEALRAGDLDAGLAWRRKVREELLLPLTSGWQVTAMTPDRSHLILTNTQPK